MRLIAWAAVFIGSSFVEIVFREYGGRSHWWVGVSQCALLTVAGIAALASKRFHPIGRFVLAVAALRLCWYIIAPKLGATAMVQSWSASVDWGARLLIARTLPLIGAGLMIFTLVGDGLSRRDAYLQFGNLSARAEPIPWLGISKALRWTIFGPILLAVFGIALPLFLYFTVRPNFAQAHRVLYFLPWILATAALNAANEEFQFRCVLLAHLRKVVVPGEAMLLTAVLFGIGHYYGQPSGPIGVVMAGFAGWAWAKSMIETRGFGWAFMIHVVQDIVIFSFLAMSVPS
jgi:membrane protease YdiL (CAAX protease family)